MTTFDSITAKVRDGRRISAGEALFLFESNDLLAIGELAALVNERKNGKNVFFNVNRHINPTNICVNRCSFCAFYRTAADEGAYTLALEEICRRGREATPRRAIGSWTSACRPARGTAQPMGSTRRVRWSGSEAGLRWTEGSATTAT